MRTVRRGDFRAETRPGRSRDLALTGPVAGCEESRRTFLVVRHDRLLSLAAGTILDVGPAEAVSVAAAAGWPAVGIWFDPHTWSPSTTRDVRDRLDSTGLVALDIEPVIFGVDGDPGERTIDVAAEIGARHVLVASRLDDQAAVAARFGELCDRAAPLGLTLVFEFLPIFGVKTLTEATAIVSDAGRPNGGVLVDTLHLDRSGGSPAELAAIELAARDRVLFPYLQVADAPRERPIGIDSLVEEALHGRMLPGMGALPIGEVLDAVRGVPLSFELRSRSLREAHPDPVERARTVLDCWRRFSAA